jgi:AsmA protein
MRKLLLGAATVILLLIVGAIAAPFFIPVSSYKSELITRVKEATGRDLRINGNISFAVIPRLAFEADDVALANVPGGRIPDMARFAQLQIALKPLPLLQGRIEVDKLVLIDPVIALEVDKQGRPNWQLGTAGTTAQARPAEPTPSIPPAAPRGGGTLASVRLHDVRLQNGKISYFDARNGSTLMIEQIHVTLTRPDLDSPLETEGSLVYRGETLNLALSLADPQAFLAGESSTAAIKLKAKPIVFEFNGNAAGSTPLKLDGRADLTIPSVRQLAQWAGSPIVVAGAGFGRLAIAGIVSLSGNQMSFTDATVALDNIHGKGAIALDSSGARPALKGQLDLDKLDANPYLPPETKGKPGAGGAGKSAGWSDELIDLAPLKTADVDFAVSAGSLLYRKIQIGKSALELHLKDGRLEADLNELALYHGGGKGRVMVDGSGAVPVIDLHFDLSHVQVEPLLAAAVDLDRVSGVGALDIAVSGHGKSEREIIAELHGKGSFSLGDGSIKGIDLVAMAKNAAGAFAGGAQSGQQTRFGSLSGSYTIANGVVHNNDLRLVSAQVPMTGAGIVDLPHQSVDYKVTPRLAGAVAVPVVVKGPWSDLAYAPDLGGIVGDPSKLLRGAGEGAGSTIKGGEDAIKGIFGGKKP